MWSDEWNDFRNHSYKYFSHTRISASEAHEECFAIGGMLVSVNSQEEHDFLSDRVLRQRTLSAFIGGTDHVQEGSFV